MPIFLLTVASFLGLLVPSVAYTLSPIPAPTLQGAIAAVLGFIAGIGILILFPLVLLVGISFILWRYWKKKSVKQAIWIVAKILIIIVVVILILFLSRWLLLQTVDR